MSQEFTKDLNVSVRYCERYSYPPVQSALCQSCSRRVTGATTNSTTLTYDQRALGSYVDVTLWGASGMSLMGDREGEGNRSARMHCEKERLRTFYGWPHGAPVRPADLAQAGFYFLGPGDAVRCFCCGGTLRQWAHGDSPLMEHRRHFPACNFVSGRSEGNILGAPFGTDSVDGQLLSQLQRMAPDENVTTVQAAYPEMESVETRLTTFSNWPTNAHVQPDTVAQAGFFYTGHGDNVKCFFCDGGLRNWEPGDDPWQEHAKWFPRCEYLLHARGQEYVSNIQQSYFSMSETGESQALTAEGFTTSHVLSGQSALAVGMFSPVVQTVLQMGFERALVESLVQSHYLLTGCHYTTVSDLVSDILHAEEEKRQGIGYNTESVVRQGGNADGTNNQASSGKKVLGNLNPEEQLRQLQEERTCKVCMDKQVSMVFIPCGHLVVCTECATSLHRCPICRALIRGSVHAFMS